MASRSWVAGRFRGVPIEVTASWWLVAAFLTVTFAPRVEAQAPGLGTWAYVVAFAFAVLLYVSVLVHELSHTAVALAFGLPVRRITLHVLGGVSEIEQLPQTPARELAVSGSGPVISLGLGGLAAVLAQALPDGGVARLLCEQLMLANLLVGVFNLLPGLPLDGGHVLSAVVWRMTGDPRRGTAVAAVAGRVTAGVILALPFVLAWWWGGRPDLVSIVWAGVIASFVWTGSGQALAGARLEDRVSALTSRSVARPAAVVPVSASLADATALGSGGPVVVTDVGGRAVALLHSPSADAVPMDRRAFVTVGSVSRTLEESMVLDAGLSGRPLLETMAAHPAAEYLVIESDGRVAGVLLTSDVETALAGR